MIKFIIHRRKAKGKVALPIEIIERLALERVMPQAKEKARKEICQDCRDKRCLQSRECKAFELLSKTCAWDMVVSSAELN